MFYMSKAYKLNKLVVIDKRNHKTFMWPFVQVLGSRMRISAAHR